MRDESSLALFCDFENVALGVRDAKLDKFDIQPVMERLLLKGSIVVKKAYCDWARYRDFKTQMHGAAFELIEIPHVRQSGKNSADIRMVVDALDLCYTKAHIDTFVIISGDSDFSPLVSKLRENAKTVIGVGVKSSTSELLISNCDEFIFYDDLVAKVATPRRRRAPAAKAAGVDAEAAVKSPVKPAARRSRGRTAKSAASSLVAPAAEATAVSPAEAALKTEGLKLVLEIAEALHAERGDRAKLWGSMIKQTLQRRRPGFNETAFGFKSFNDMLDEAATRGFLDVERDEKSGGYLIRKIVRQPT